MAPQHPTDDERPALIELHFILTLKKPIRGGSEMFSTSDIVTAPAGTTRMQVYKDLLEHVFTTYPDFRGAVPVFFSLEPNRL